MLDESQSIMVLATARSSEIDQIVATQQAIDEMIQLSNDEVMEMDAVASAPPAPSVQELIAAFVDEVE